MTLAIMQPYLFPYIGYWQLINDEKVYHLGASLKDLGKKWFAFSLMEEDSMMLREKIKEVLDGK